MRTVLIVENDPNEFMKVKLRFESWGWAVLPKDHNEYANLFNPSSKANLVKYIEYEIKENYRDIRLIVLDLNLYGQSFEDRAGLDIVLPVIRGFNALDLEDDYANFPTQVPVIVFSHFDDFDTKKKVLGHSQHANFFVAKGTVESTGLKSVEQKINDEELILVAENLSTIFTFALNNQHQDISKQVEIKGQLERITNLLELNNELITAEFADLKFVIKGDFEKVNKTLDLILKSTLLSLTEDQVKELLDNYCQELISELGQAKYDELARKAFESSDFRHQFKKAVKDGSFVDLAEFCVSTAEELGILDFIPGGKIVGHGFTALMKIISK